MDQNISKEDDHDITVEIKSTDERDHGSVINVETGSRNSSRSILQGIILSPSRDQHDSHKSNPNVNSGDRKFSHSDSHSQMGNKNSGNRRYILPPPLSLLSLLLSVPFTSLSLLFRSRESG